MLQFAFRVLTFIGLVTAAVASLLLDWNDVASRPANAAEPQKVPVTEWFIRPPAKDYKDLPALTFDRDVTHGDTLGNVTFVCDRSRYYILLVTPLFPYGPSQPGRVLVAGPDGAAADPYVATFRDLYKSRVPPASKIDWDADILASGIPKTVLMKLSDGGTLRIEIKDMAWDVDLKTIAAKVRSFTAFCETGRRLDPSHFRS